MCVSTCKKKNVKTSKPWFWCVTCKGQWISLPFMTSTAKAKQHTNAGVLEFRWVMKTMKTISDQDCVDVSSVTYDHQWVTSRSLSLLAGDSALEAPAMKLPRAPNQKSVLSELPVLWSCLVPLTRRATSVSSQSYASYTRSPGCHIATAPSEEAVWHSKRRNMGWALIRRLYIFMQNGSEKNL